MTMQLRIKVIAADMSQSTMNHMQHGVITDTIALCLALTLALAGVDVLIKLRRRALHSCVIQ